MNALFNAVGVDLPTAAHLGAAGDAVLLPLAVGVGAALIASVAPAIRATRVPPIAALREGFVLPPGPAGAVRALHRADRGGVLGSG